jgi:hypothetical protein
MLPVCELALEDDAFRMLAANVTENGVNIDPVGLQHSGVEFV